MVLQAYVDESGSENQHPALIMSGYIAPAEKWAAFSDAWDSALKMKPSLESFKMNDAVRLKNDFWRWDPKIRDERLRLLRRIIQDHALTYVSCVVPFEGFYKALQVLHPYKIKLKPYGVALLFLMGAPVSIGNLSELTGVSTSSSTIRLWRKRS